MATDQVPDSPSNSFATLNPLVPAAVSGSIFSEGNLKYRTYKTGGDNVQGEGTIGFTSGKWYWEIYLVGFEGSTARRGGIGVGDAISNETWTTACTEAAILSVGNLNPQAHNVVNATTGSSWSTGAAGDIWCCAFDADAGTFIITKNTAVTGSESDGKWTGFATSTVGYRPITVEQSGSDYTEFVYNFGQDSSFAGNKTSGAAGSDFYFTKPTGYKALNSSNLDNPAIALPKQYFNTVLYTGDGTDGRTISGVGFEPDWLWNKSRSATGHHMVYDSVRGSSGGYLLRLKTNAASAETATSDEIKSFTSDGFITDSSQNASSVTYVAWNWKAASSNTSVCAGSIDGTNPTIACTRRTNTTAGFSIVSYSGSGSAGDTVAHGLSQTPDLIIIKNRSAITNWVVNSPSIDSAFTKWALKLDLTEAISTDSTIWNNTAPNSTVFTLGTAGESNRNNPDNYIAYCFNSVEGYSKIGSYTGNGNADGTFVYTGFTPAFVLVRKVSGDNWAIYDNARDPYNVMSKQLYPDADSTEETSSARYIDFVSNGIKIRGTNSRTNTSGESYLYYAVASNPFKTSNAR